MARDPDSTRGPGTNALAVVVGNWARLGPDASAVRTEVFVQEQKIPAELEWDEGDAHCLHCVVYLEGQAVGTGRLLPDAHIGRMAVLASQRRHGIGAMILRELMTAGWARGEKRLELSAQSYVAVFYARHGFVAQGDEFMEAGIPHVRMVCQRLAPNAEVLFSQSSSHMADGKYLQRYDWVPNTGAARGVYLLHGLGEHAGRYDALARWFCERGWRVRAHDHVGHGKSAGSRGFVSRHAQLAEHAGAMIGEFASELGAAPLLLGHSLGGVLAADLVLSHGVQVDGLVLSSPGLDPGLNRAQLLLLAVLERLAPGLRVGNGLDPGAISHDAKEVDKYRHDPLVHDRICARLLRWMVDAGRDALDHAGLLQVDTLLMVAGDDRLVNAAASREFARRAPVKRVALCWYDGLYHEIFNEAAPDRQRVLADLDSWLALRSAPGSGLQRTV